MTDHPILFLPGPTEVDAELRAILSRPQVGHRQKVFIDETIAICGKLRALYRTSQHALYETCPATALMEAAIRNLVPPGGKTLHLVCGAFSERWSKIAGWCGRNPENLTVPMGQAHTPEQLRTHLRSGSNYSAIAITHNETSSGVLEPLGELAAVARELAPDAMLLVDVVTSLAGAEVAFDDWGLDLAFAGTQKCLALPPGLTTFAVSKRAIDRAATVPDRGFLFDLVRTVPETEAGKPLATPCVPLAFALSRQLDRVLQEGLPARAARHLAMRDTVLQRCQQVGIEPFVAEPARRSPSVSCLHASGHDVAALAARAKAAGFLIDQGYGDLKGKTFRIGHMGDHSVARVQALLAALLP